MRMWCQLNTFFFLVRCVCTCVCVFAQVSFFSSHFLHSLNDWMTEWCTHNLFAYIKVSLSLIMANHRVHIYIGIAYRYIHLHSYYTTIECFFFHLFFLLAHLFGYESHGLSSVATASSITSLAVVVRCFQSFLHRTTDCFNYNYVSVWQRALP